MEEERRLCYVGMTRAEKKLYLSWARYRRRFGGGQPEPSIRSRFLKEVPRDADRDASAGEPQAGTSICTPSATRSAKPPSGTSILERLTIQSITSSSFSRSAACRRPAASPPSGSVSAAGNRRSQLPRSQRRPAKPKKFGPGSTVEHAKYGRGTVLRLEGTGDDTKVTVSFPGYGLKKLIAKYAGIKVE